MTRMKMTRMRMTRMKMTRSSRAAWTSTTMTPVIPVRTEAPSTKTTSKTRDPNAGPELTEVSATKEGYLFFNAFGANNREDILSDSKKELIKMIKARSLKHDYNAADDIGGCVNTFSHAENKSQLFDLLREMSDLMRFDSAREGLESELEFMWPGFDTIRFHWGKSYMFMKHLEGWVMMFIHSRILNIFHTKSGTQLHMTDKKTMKDRPSPKDSGGGSYTRSKRPTPSRRKYDRHGGQWPLPSYVVVLFKRRIKTTIDDMKASKMRK